MWSEGLVSDRDQRTTADKKSPNVLARVCGCVTSAFWGTSYAVLDYSVPP